MNALEGIALFLGLVAGIKLVQTLIEAGFTEHEDDGPDTPPPPPSGA